MIVTAILLAISYIWLFVATVYLTPELNKETDFSLSDKYKDL